VNAPTKDELCAELMKSDLNGTFFFYAHGTGGCDGPPCVSVRVKKEDKSDVPDGDSALCGTYAKAHNNLFTTIDYFYVKEKCLERPTEQYSTKVNKFYYRKYKTIQDLAEAVITSIKIHHKVKVI
jgi:hypothetical protein